MNSNGSVFTDKFDKLSLKRQYFTLKHGLTLENQTILCDPEFEKWTKINQPALLRWATTWNVEYNSFKP